MGVVRQPEISNHRMTTVPELEGGIEGVVYQSQEELGPCWEPR